VQAVPRQCYPLEQVLTAAALWVQASMGAEQSQSLPMQVLLLRPSST
jgi:hypothetical protein